MNQVKAASGIKLGRASKRLAGVLNADEPVERLVKTIGEGFMAATPDRVVSFVKESDQLVGGEQTVLTYDKLTGVAVDAGVVFATLKLVAPGVEVKLSQLTKEEANDFANYVRARMAGDKPPATTASAPGEVTAMHKAAGVLGVLAVLVISFAIFGGDDEPAEPVEAAKASEPAEKKPEPASLDEAVEEAVADAWNRDSVKKVRCDKQQLCAIDARLPALWDGEHDEIARHMGDAADRVFADTDAKRVILNGLGDTTDGLGNESKDSKIATLSTTRQQWSKLTWDNISDPLVMRQVVDTLAIFVGA